VRIIVTTINVVANYVLQLLRNNCRALTIELSLKVRFLHLTVLNLPIKQFSIATFCEFNIRTLEIVRFLKTRWTSFVLIVNSAQTLPKSSITTGEPLTPSPFNPKALLKFSRVSLVNLNFTLFLFNFSNAFNRL
jgi:hypothetical protein